MTANDVYASKGGRRYHSHPHCPAFRMGNDLWEFKADEWVPGMPTAFLSNGYGLELIDITEAAERGLARCQRCRPIPTYREPEDFGHEPMDVRQVLGLGYVQAQFTACARCFPTAPRWPCASAVVLGLPVARPA